MIRVIVFDLDGVLFDGVSLHRKCFLDAVQLVAPNSTGLESFHDTQLNGLSTSQKLRQLQDKEILTKEQCKQVEEKKKEFTGVAIKELVHYSEKTGELLVKLQKEGYILCCVTNSIRSTANNILIQLGILQYFSVVISNEDVSQPKPSSEPYTTLFERLTVSPQECLILEDSTVGRTAAYASGANVLQIVDPQDVTYQNIHQAIQQIQLPVSVPEVQVVNIVIPMAGHGSRFSSKGYTVPKPFIPVFTKPMIQWVIENIRPVDEYYGSVRVPCKILPKFHFVAQAEHLKHYDLRQICRQLSIDYTITTVDSVTEGPACTVLLTKEYINTSDPLITINSDQFLDWSVNDFYRSLLNPSYDGCINTFHQPNSADIKWSYAKLDSDGLVTEVAEKKYISNLATTGVYGWKQGQQFVAHAEEMMRANDRVNNEFYVAPVYNYLIKSGGKVRTYNCKKLWGLGVPEDLEYFLQMYVSS